MKKIVLVNPPYLFWAAEKNYLRPFIGTLPSLGLLSLAAVLRKQGYSVKIVESASLGWSFPQTLEMILRQEPDCLGLTCSTTAVDNAARIALEVKEKRPGIVTFIGGAHITALPRQTFLRYPIFDYGVTGEGEEAFPELLQAVEKGVDLHRVESAVFREGGEILVNPRRKLIEDLDGLPFPAYDLLPFFPGRYRPPLLNYPKGPTASLSTSRGCPQICTFCDRSVFGNRYRYFSADYLFELISYLHRRYGLRHLVFTDDQFAASRSRLLAFCEKLSGADFKIQWNCDARVDSVDLDILKLMKRAGCWMISYGIESGSQEILNMIHKGITIDQVERAVRWTKEAGIRAKGLFMIGYPQETEETLGQTLSLLLHSPLDEMNLSFLTPYPGTEIYQQARHSAGFAEDWPKMNAMHPLLKPERLSTEALQKAYARILRKFYTRPGITFSYLGLLIQSPENCRRLASGILRRVLSYVSPLRNLL